MLSKKQLQDIKVSLDEYPHVTENQTLQDAIDKMLSYTGPSSGHVRVHELVVLDGTGRLTGTLSCKQVLIAMEPNLLQTHIKSYEGFTVDFSNNAILWEEPFFAKCGENLVQSVYDFASPITTVLKLTDSVLKALYIMINTGRELLPLEGENGIEGVVPLENVFACVANCCALPGSIHK